MLFDEGKNAVPQKIARIPYVHGRASIFRANRESDEADDFGCKRLGIRRCTIGENVGYAANQINEKTGDALICTESAAEMIIDRRKATAQLHRGYAHKDQRSAALRR